MSIKKLGKFGAALGTLLLLSGLAATPAKAVLITQWDYVVGSGFAPCAQPLGSPRPRSGPSACRRY